MLNCFLIFLLFMSFPASAQNAPAHQVAPQAQGALIRNIVMQGFVLEEDKNQFAKLFKPYRNKHLSAADMDTILQQLQKIYEEEGYRGLVSIEYHVHRKLLTFTVSLIK